MKENESLRQEMDVVGLVLQAAAETSRFLGPVTKKKKKLDHGHMNSDRNKKEKSSQGIGVVQRVGNSQTRDLFFFSNIWGSREDPGQRGFQNSSTFLFILFSCRLRRGLSGERWLPSLF